MTAQPPSDLTTFANVAYPATCFPELAPARLNYVAALHGARTRDLARPFNYLELGSGPSWSTLVHAASAPHARFHACDLHEASIIGARAHAQRFGIANIELHACGFAQLRERLPPDIRFDFIVAHGIWTWIPPEARADLLAVVSELLAPEGLFYLSYNCLPGAASDAPLRRLLQELVLSAEGDAEARMRDALLELATFAETRHFASQPELQAAARSLVRQPDAYLVHEFMNPDATAAWSVDVEDELAAIGLRRIGSATLADNHDALVHESAAIAHITAQPTSRLRTLARDFAANRRFRRDVFVRESHPTADDGELGRQLLGCTIALEALGVDARVPRGLLQLDADFLARLRELLAHGPASIASLVRGLGADGARAAEITRNLLYLVASGGLVPFAQLNAASDAGSHAPLRQMLAWVAAGNTPAVVPSCALGGGVVIDADEATRLLACLRRMDSGADEELVDRMTRIGVLAPQGGRGTRAV